METRIYKIEIITRPENYEALKKELSKIGITGLTVYTVLGAGMSLGFKEIYRGNEVEVDLNHKIKLEIIVCDTPIENVVAVTKQVCQTGNYGDGKIFVSPILNVAKIRTGEEGKNALQYEDKSQK